MNKKVDPRLQSPRASGRPRGLLGVLKRSLVTQLLAAVGLPYALLFPLLHLGWLDGIAFSVTAALLATLTFAGIRVAISVAQLRKEPPRIDIPDPGPVVSGSSLDVPRTPERGNETVVHRAVARELVLEAERDAAVRESAAQRDLLKQLERAQRIARLGS